MRRPSLALTALLLLAGCGSGDDGAAPGPSAAPSSSATVSATPAGAPLDAAAVRQAVETTRAAGTGKYVAELATTMAGGKVTVRQRGSYDLGAKKSAVDSDYEFGAPELAASLGIDPNQDLRSRAITAPSGAYLTMPGWKDERRGKWMHYTPAEIAEYGADVGGEPFPPLVAVLSEAEDAPGEKATADQVVVSVPAGDLFAAFPTSSTRKLVAAGLDPAELTGDVLVAVKIDAEGRIVRVRADADEVFDQAYEKAGIPNAAAAGSLTRAVVADVTLSAFGQPVRITVPAGDDVIAVKDLS